jgi:O-antigen biosynthesis protein
MILSRQRVSAHRERSYVENGRTTVEDQLEALVQIARPDPRMKVLRNEANLGFVATCNRGLAERRGDAVLLNSDTIVTPDWLRELAEVAHSDPHIACVSPLSNNATICSVPRASAHL